MVSQKPLERYIIVKETRISSGGIIKAASFKDKPLKPHQKDPKVIEKGEVLEVGSECKELKEGDIVYYTAPTGLVFEITDDAFIKMMHESEVFLRDKREEE